MKVEELIKDMPVDSSKKNIHLQKNWSLSQLTLKLAKNFGNTHSITIKPHLYLSSLTMGRIKRLRQLSSAESAKLIWDERGSSNEMSDELQKIRHIIRPDIVYSRTDFSEINKYETKYLYNEIFNNKVYEKYGVTIPTRGVVFDIGANIGMFSRYVCKMSEETQIYAFEPSREAFKKLKENQTSRMQIYNQGIGHKAGKELFTYYPGYSVISGFHTNKKLDREVIIKGEMAFTNDHETKVRKKINNRFKSSRNYIVQMNTISNFIKQQKIKRIDLLKIDVEKHEIKVLAGIDQGDWNIIKQVVIEVHDSKSVLEIKELLNTKKFKVKIDKDELLDATDISTLYGWKA